MIEGLVDAGMQRTNTGDVKIIINRDDQTIIQQACSPFLHYLINCLNPYSLMSNNILTIAIDGLFDAGS